LTSGKSRLGGRALFWPCCSWGLSQFGGELAAVEAEHADANPPMFDADVGGLEVALADARPCSAPGAVGCGGGVVHQADSVGDSAG